MTTVANHNVRIGADISDFEQAMHDMEEQLKEVGEKMKEVGETLTKGLTVPIAALGTAGFMMASDMQKGQGKIQASLGVTAKEAQHLGDVAKDVWKNNFGESIGDVSDAIVKVKQYMGDLNDTDLKTVTEGAYTLSDAFGVDISDSTKTASSLMKNFKIDAGHAMDLITVGFQKGGDFSGELLDTLNEYAPQFSSMGLSAEDFLGILISGAKNGAFNLDKVGDAVKEFNVRAQDGSQTTQQGFQLVGLNAKKMGEAIAGGGAEGKKAFEATIAALAAIKDPLKQNIAGVDLFGTQWEDVRSNVILAMTDGVGSIKNVEGATKKAGDALYNNLGSKATALWRDFQASLEPVGEVLINLGEQILPPIGKALTTVANAFSKLSPTMQTIIVIVGIFLAALGPLLIMLGSLITAITTIMPIITAIGGAFAAVASVGILPIIAAIAALVAIGIILYKNWDTIKTYLMAAWQAIVDFVKPIIADLVAFINIQMSRLKGLWNKYGAEIMQIVDIMWTTIKGYFNTYLAVILTVIKGGWELIKGVVKAAIEAVKAVIKVTIDVIVGIVSAFLSALKGDWSGAFEALKTMVSSVFGDIFKMFSNMGKIFYDAGKGLIEQVVQGIENAASKAYNAIKKVAGKIRDFLPFSPAKVGPLSDLDKLDFGGPITDSIKSALPNVQKMMTGLVSLPNINTASSLAMDGGGGTPIELYMDGRKVGNGVMPHVVSGIKQKTGIKFV